MTQKTDKTDEIQDCESVNRGVFFNHDPSATIGICEWNDANKEAVFRLNMPFTALLKPKRRSVKKFRGHRLKARQ